MTHDSRLSAYHFHERDWRGYDHLQSEFEWEVPERFNTARYVCDRWAGTARTAVYAEEAGGEGETYTYGDLRDRSNRLANVLADADVKRGDRIAVTASQRPETLVGHLAAWKIGAVSVPISPLVGTDALRYRLNDCRATVAILDGSNIETLGAVADDVDSLELVVGIGDSVSGVDAASTRFDDALAEASAERSTVATEAEDGAMIIYTSGTTGKPKGVVHAHRYLLGQLPSFVTLFCNMELHEDDRFWTPSDWGWVGPFYGLVLPTLFYGKSLVSHHAARFDPERAFELLDTYRVNGTSLPPTAVRKMEGVDDIGRFDLGGVRAVVCGGEAVTERLVDWVERTFDAPVHEGYGQTEATSVIGSVAALGVKRAGKMGKAQIGHEVRVVDPTTAEPNVPPGEVGEIAVSYEGDPGCFVRYWELPEATDAKVKNGWLLTEDLGRRDKDGYFEFVGRKDDVIISSGYRIGPEEIEDVLSAHEAVADAGVVAVPDPGRGEVPKAFVTLSPDVAAPDDLVAELKGHVKEHLAAYKAPRDIAVADELPRTPTGKIDRAALGPSGENP